MAAPADHNSTSRDEIILPPSNHPYVIKVTGTNYFCDIIRGNNVSNDILDLCYTTNPPHPVAIYTTAKFNNVDFDYNRQRETLWSNYTIPTTTTFVVPEEQEQVNPLFNDRLAQAVRDNHLDEDEQESPSPPPPRTQEVPPPQGGSQPSTTCSLVEAICREQETTHMPPTLANNTGTFYDPDLIPTPTGPSFNQRQEQLLAFENRFLTGGNNINHVLPLANGQPPDIVATKVYKNKHNTTPTTHQHPNPIMRNLPPTINHNNSTAGGTANISNGNLSPRVVISNINKKNNSNNQGVEKGQPRKASATTNGHKTGHSQPGKRPTNTELYKIYKDTLKADEESKRRKSN